MGTEFHPDLDELYFIYGLQEFLNGLEPDMLGTDYCFHQQDIKSPNKKFTSFLR